jgi:molybdate transport system regulatory protein
MPIPAIRFRVDFGRRQAVGPGKIALLERIGQSGSLSQAARDLRMSYRRAWLLLASVNVCFREPVAITSRGGRGGGGATLTDFGRQLIRIYRAFDAQMQTRAARCFRPIVGGAGTGGARAASAARGAKPGRGARRTAAAAVMRLSDR